MSDASFREYLALLDGGGELNRIDQPISRNLEASAITMLANRRDDLIPVFESVTDVDLLEFPWPYIHEGDRGRYSNLHTLVAADPDSEWTDWSYHRAMVQDDTRASLLLLAGEQTPNLYYYKYERREHAHLADADLRTRAREVLQEAGFAPDAVTSGGDPWA